MVRIVKIGLFRQGLIELLRQTNYKKPQCPVADPRGPGGPCDPPFFGFFFIYFFYTKAKFTSNKLVFKTVYEICLKMLEMAILETQIFKHFCRSMPPDPPRKLGPSAFVGSPSPPAPLLKALDPPLMSLPY